MTTDPVACPRCHGLGKWVNDAGTFSVLCPECEGTGKVPVAQTHTFERIVTMSPAFHRVHKDPSKNYGVGGVSLRMVLLGPLGAVQFLLLTGWYLPETLAWWDSRGLERDLKPTPADKGYHWSTPQYEGQEARECDLLPGGKCYYDGSSLNADGVYQTLLKEGSDGVWRELEEYYHYMATRKEDAA